jgi:hypothetical protein
MTNLGARIEKRDSAFEFLYCTVYSFSILMPVISPERAFAFILVAACILYLSFLIFIRRKKSNYPNLELSFVCLGAGLWLLDSIAVDRLINQNFYLWAGRLTYFFPYFILFWLIRFALKFPPKNTDRRARIVTLVSTMVGLFGAFLAMHPSGFVVVLNSSNQQTINHRLYYYITLLCFLILLLITASTFSFKWRHILTLDKKTIKIFLVGVFVAAVLGITVSLVNSFRNDALFYQYAYPPIIVFVGSLLYTFFKLGGFGISVVLSKRSLVIGLITLTVLVVLTLL